MNIRNFAVAILPCCALTVAFSAKAVEAEKELVSENTRGRWTFSAGPAWRSHVTIDTSGTVLPQAPVARQTNSRNMNDSANWDRQNKTADPKAGTGGIPADGQLWGVTDARTEISGTAGYPYAVNQSDVERPLGVNLQGCYDFYQGATWSIGLNLHLAGYWNMKSSTSGRFIDRTTQTDVYTDQYVFEDTDVDYPFWDEVDPRGSTPTYAGESLNSRVVDYNNSRAISTRFRGDLYQIGLGPKVTWSPFVGWCDCLNWLDVYGGVDFLCNILYSEFEADGNSTSQTNCRFGVGGNLGLVGNITDWLGIYGQVGYEWIDKSDIFTGDFKADIDYSSLVVSAGVQFRF